MVREVLRDGIRITVKGLVYIIPLQILSTLFYMALAYQYEYGVFGLDPDLPNRERLLQGLSFVVMTPFMVAFIYIYGQLYKRQPVTLSRVISITFRKWPKLLIVNVVFLMLVALATFALIIPGVFVLLSFLVCTQVAVYEKESIADTMITSWQLSKNNRWKILLTSMILIIPFVVVIAHGFTHGYLDLGWVVKGSYDSIVDALSNLLFTPCLCVLYFSLKDRYTEKSETINPSLC